MLRLARIPWTTFPRLYLSSSSVTLLACCSLAFLPLAITKIKMKLIHSFLSLVVNLQSPLDLDCCTLLDLGVVEVADEDGAGDDRDVQDAMNGDGSWKSESVRERQRERDKERGPCNVNVALKGLIWNHAT